MFGCINSKVLTPERRLVLLCFELAPDVLRTAEAGRRRRPRPSGHHMPILHVLELRIVILFAREKGIKLGCPGSRESCSPSSSSAAAATDGFVDVAAPTDFFLL